MKVLKLAGAIALALSTGLATHASAQSANVTLYGIIDAYVASLGAGPGGVNALDKRTTRVEGGGMSTSRFGLSGSEDLGNGLTASFDLSSFFRNDTGAVGRNDAIGAPVNVAADPFFSRAAWVGLSSTSLGRIRVGNITTLMFLNSITSNAFGDSTIFSPLNVVGFVASPLTGGTAWTDSVVYDTPNFSGFTASIAHALSENRGGYNTGLRAAYSGGPFALSGAWQTAKKNPLTFADGTSPNNTRSWQVGGSYDFQVVKLFAHAGEIVNKGTETAPANIKYRLYEASALVPLGAGNVLVGYAQRTTGDAVGLVPATGTGGNKERKMFTIGYDYNLSKRTDAYLMVSLDKTLTNTLPGPGTLISAKATNVGLGVRHRF